MKPFDEDVAPPIDESSEDDKKEDFDIEEEITIRRSRRGHRRSRGKQYGSGASFAVWIGFVIVWLFFFASGYGIFENIAIVLVALLVLGALNAIMWIPSYEGGWRAKTSVVTGVIWIIFLIIWVAFYAIGFGFYENIGIALASLLLVGAVNVGMWVPKHGDEGGGRVSALGAIFWLTFIVLWLPFANDFSLIYPINAYQNFSIIMTSFLLMVAIVIAPWRGEIRVGIDAEPGLYPRVRGTLVGFVLWLIFIDVWFWFLAGIYTGNQNVALLLFSFAIFCGIIMAAWLPWSRKRGEGPENWGAIGLAFVWVIVLALWFWFFADGFDAYQNFAVFLVSLLVIAAISGGAQWKKYRDFEAMDWDD
ncbi:MAG: hypothetical protein ACXAAQ_05445 [Candidatus Thorarchaeota archaeon]|jgi:hypothetical protein